MSQTARSIERFFQFSLLGLVTSGYLALAGSGYLDRPTLVLTLLGLLTRGAMVAGFLQARITSRDTSIAALAYVAFFPIDFYFISHDFLNATVHGVCFLAVIKILTAQSNRDYIYTGVISFIELVAAAVISARSSFFAYLALYLVFAIAAFTSAEVRAGLQSGGSAAAPWRAGIAWRLAAVACAATVGILVLTAGLFLTVPRTARMAAMLFPSTPRLTGFSRVVDLGGLGKIARDDRSVMHVLSSGGSLPPDIKWRGAALSDFDGVRWSEARLRDVVVPAQNNVAIVANRSQLSRRDGHRILYRADVQNSDTGTLFIAGIPEFINIDTRFLLERSGDSFRVPGAARETLRYQVSAHAGAPLLTRLTEEERARDLRLPPMDVRILSLARDWAGIGSPVDRALRIQRHLQRDFKYKLDGPATRVRDPLADFLFVRKEGYCEYFASAMAVMLRSLGVPSRIATGFHNGYYNDVSGLYVVRASDAHAWVEAWIDGMGWRTFDPTPLLPQNESAGILPRINMYLEAMDHTWQEWVVSYDLGHQVAMAARLETALRQLGRPRPNALAIAQIWIAWAFGLLALVAAGVFLGPGLWRSWRRRAQVRRMIRVGGSPSDAGILYSCMLEILARRGFEKPSWFTPAEFARYLPATEKTSVLRFTELYNSVRFGGDAAETSRLALMLREFDGH